MFYLENEGVTLNYFGLYILPMFFASLFWLVLNVGLLIKKQNIQKYKIIVVEMRMLRWVSENTWKDGIQTEEIPLKIRVTHIVEKMR